MSPAHVLEPTYDALRRRLVAGDWPPRCRLEAVRLAEELGVSITPVRDALNRLTGERLVESEPGEGFRVPRLDGADLRTAFAWHHRLMTMAIRWRGGPFPAIDIPQGHDGIGERTALLFGSIAATAHNGELNRAVSQAAARLNPRTERCCMEVGRAGPDIAFSSRLTHACTAPRHSGSRGASTIARHYERQTRTVRRPHRNHGADCRLVAAWPWECGSPTPFGLDDAA